MNDATAPAPPPGTYAGGQRSPIVWVYLCAPCAGYAEITPADYQGALSGHCDGCGNWRAREVHRFPAVINSVAGCNCTGQHQQVAGDLDVKGEKATLLGPPGASPAHSTPH